MGAFIFVNKDKLNAMENTKTTVENGKKEVNDSTVKCDEISYDLKTNEYVLASAGVGLSVSTDKSRKTVSISYNGARISETFSLGWVTAADKTTFEPLDTKTFDKKISQVIIDGVGQDAQGSAILYLMEDGTVEYVPILKDINTNWQKSENSQKFNSYGKLNGVSDVISLIPADATGYHTILARKADGTVINLQKALNETGNFN